MFLGACAARSEIGAPEHDAGADAPERDASVDRACPVDCTIGHQCCAGGCSGPAVPTPNDCCACLPGEVSSLECSGGRCGR